MIGRSLADDGGDVVRRCCQEGNQKHSETSMALGAATEEASTSEDGFQHGEEQTDVYCRDVAEYTEAEANRCSHLGSFCFQTLTHVGRFLCTGRGEAVTYRQRRHLQMRRRLAIKTRRNRHLVHTCQRRDQRGHIWPRKCTRKCKQPGPEWPG